MYQEEDIISAIEVKTSGTFDNTTIKKQLKTFSKIKAMHNKIDCLYVSICGSFKARDKIKKELNKHGYGAFVFENENTQVYFTGEFEDLINRIKKLYNLFLRIIVIK